MTNNKIITISSLLLIMISLLFISNNVYALDNQRTYLVNNNNISILESEYINLVNLGFTDSEIINMTSTEFNNNKNLKGTIVSTNSVIIPYIENGGSNEILSNPGVITTLYKRLTTTIISVNNRYRYKVSLEWLNIPSNRSYDIIGIGIENEKVQVYQNISYFQQNFCYSANNCSSSIVHANKFGSTGVGASFKLPNANVVSLSSYMYFDVVKNTNNTISQLNAHGDYSHATSTVSLKDASNYNVAKYYGIVLDDSIKDYYDTIQTAVATYNTSW